jgi:hypothetical protein
VASASQVAPSQREASDVPPLLKARVQAAHKARGGGASIVELARDGPTRLETSSLSDFLSHGRRTAAILVQQYEFVGIALYNRKAVLGVVAFASCDSNRPGAGLHFRVLSTRRSERCSTSAEVCGLRRSSREFLRESGW